MKFRLLHWNILFSEPIDQIAAVIKQIDPDVACLQELIQGKQHDSGSQLTHRLGYHSHYSYRPLLFRNSGIKRLGNGIFSKHPLLQTRTVDLFNTKDSGESIGYDYSEAAVDFGGTTVTFATIHPPFHPQFRTTKNRTAILKKVCREIEAADGNYILTGDFNATPGTNFVSEVKRRLKHAGPAYTKPSWTKFNQTILGHQFKGMNWRIDYVFYKGNLKVKTSQILDVKPSDHAPILVEFEI